MKNIELKIIGMHCTACSTRLEKILKQSDGIEEVIVSLKQQSAVIQYNEKKVTLEKIKTEILDAGFEV